MDDEKPDLKEYLTETKEITVVMEFYLDSLLSKRINEIRVHLKNQFKHLNPFENPDTSTAYRIDFNSQPKPKLELYLYFRGKPKVGENSIVLWSPRQEQKLKKNLVQVTTNFKTLEAESCTIADGAVGWLLSKLDFPNNFPKKIVPLKVSGSSVIFPHKWMAHLSPKMRGVPFTMLAIPGTHNSATHTMQKDHFHAFDSPAYTDGSVRPYLSFLTPETLASWGRCVKHDINQQLEMGIRYFDFRLKI